MPLRRFLLFAGTIAAAALLVPTLPLRAEDTGWEEQLRVQVLREYDCEVAFFSQVSERILNGDQVVLAKVHCEDKRSFDAYRNSAFKKAFDIHPCDNPDNRVC
jgi:hypothetical protein